MKVRDRDVDFNAILGQSHMMRIIWLLNVAFMFRVLRPLDIPSDGWLQCNVACRIQASDGLRFSKTVRANHGMSVRLSCWAQNNLYA